MLLMEDVCLAASHITHVTNPTLYKANQILLLAEASTKVACYLLTRGVSSTAFMGGRSVIIPKKLCMFQLAAKFGTSAICLRFSSLISVSQGSFLVLQRSWMRCKSGEIWGLAGYSALSRGGRIHVLLSGLLGLLHGLLITSLRF